ncbi:MAG: hypothetical protein NC095_00870 [Muribaculum sp.]|nr:hypothetical protein [Muribaculum sp.]
MTTKKILTVVALCFASIFGFADTSTPTTSDKSGSCILRLERKGSKVKRSPSNMFIELTYEHNALTIQSNSCQGEITVLLTKCESSEEEMFLEAFIGGSVKVNLDSGLYNVTSEVSDDFVFTGEILIF